jgi:hypothetical protein
MLPKPCCTCTASRSARKAEPESAARPHPGGHGLGRWRGTIATAARQRPGCWVSIAPMSRPPFEPPRIASRLLVVRCDSIRKRAQAAKSSKTFCLAASRPAWCQSSPYFPAAPGVCDREYSTLLQPWQPAWVEPGLEGDAEAAVAGEQRGRGAVVECSARGDQGHLHQRAAGTLYSRFVGVTAGLGVPRTLT